MQRKSPVAVSISEAERKIKEHLKFICEEAFQIQIEIFKEVTH